jgi:glutaredoxin
MKPLTRVTLYTRPGCCLCDKAKAEMQRAGCEGEYELKEVNIETDPALEARYGTLIPVILINGEEAFRYRLTAAEFKRRITSI